MELLKKAKSALNFEDRYSDMEGSDGGFDRKERKRLKQIKERGGRVDQDRLDYLNTIRDERTRAIGTGVAAIGGTALGIATGNPMLIKGSLGMGAQYMGGEMGEVDGPNDGVGQQLGIQDAMRVASPFLAGIGQGSGGEAGAAPGAVPGAVPGGVPDSFDLEGNLQGLPTFGMRQGGKLRYNPRKHDYIKGNTFGL